MTLPPVELPSNLDELGALRQWVHWRFLPNLDDPAGKPRKVPVGIDGGKSGVDEAHAGTWSTWREARRAFDARRATGLGFVLPLAGVIVGVDLDHVIDEAGNVEAWATRVVEELDSYTEFSPSGAGLHVLAYGSMPGAGNKVGPFEMYGRERYFTFTGRGFGEWGARPLRRGEGVQAAIAAVHRRHVIEARGRAGAPAPPAPPTTARALPAGDERDRVAAMLASRNGASIRRLGDGDDSGHGGDASVADLAYVGHLSWWLDGDAGAIDRAFRASGRMRAKWDERRGELTYGQRTIAAALATRTGGYRGAGATVRATSSVTTVRAVAPASASVVEGASGPAVVPFGTIGLGDVKARPVRWAWRHRVAFGTVALVDGDPGVGKTFVAVDLAARWASGIGMPDGSPWSTGREDGQGPGVPVLFVGLDDGLRHAVVPRFVAAMGEAREGVPNVRLWPDDCALSMPDDGERLAATILALGVRVVVVDTLVRATDERKELGDYQMASSVVGEFDRVARETRAAILLVNHHTKVAGQVAINRGYGSKGGVNGVARSVIALTRDHGAPPGERRYALEVVKSNYGPVPPPVAYRLASAWVEGEDEDGRREVLPTAFVEWLPDVVPVGASDVRARRGADAAAREDAIAAEVLAGGALARPELDAALLAAGIGPDRVKVVRERCAIGRRRKGDATAWEYVARATGTAVPDDDPDELGPIEAPPNGLATSLAGWS